MNEFQFSITTGVNDLTNPSYLYIRYPYYYAPGLSSKGVFYCTIDGDPVYCQNTQDRELIIRNFIKTYPKNTAHTINIYGVDGVIQPSTPLNIFIAVDSDSDRSVVTEQIMLTDPGQSVTTTANVGIIQISNITISTTEFRVTNAYTVIFTSPSASTPAGDYLIIDFPGDYSTFFQVSTYTPTCKLTQVDTTVPTVYSSSCTVFGLRLKMALDIALDPSTSFVVQINNIRNPDTAFCRSNKLVLSLATSDQATVLYRSNPANINSNWITFAENPLLYTLIWSLDPTSEAMTIPVQLISGIFSQQICLHARGTKYSEDLTSIINSLDSDKFSVSTGANFIAQTGSTAACFQIAASIDTPPTFYEIKFDKTEEFPSPQNFTAIPRLLIELKSQVVTVSARDTTYYVPLLGRSMPIIVDFGINTPKHDLTITASISDTSMFLFDETNTQVVNASFSQCYFTVKTTLTAVVGSSTTLTFTLSGADKSAYLVSPASVTLTVIASETSKDALPVVTLSDVRLTTSQQIFVNTSAPAVLYWGIALQRTYSRPCEYIKRSAFSYYTFEMTDPAQEQFGFTYTTVSGSLSTSFKIYNMLSNKDYQVTVCALLLNRIETNSTPLSFTSTDNNIRIVKVEFVFDTALTVSQELQFACFLASEFLVFKTK